MEESAEDMKKLLSILRNRIIDFSKTMPSPQLSDPGIKTDLVIPVGLNPQNLSDLPISNVLPGRKPTGSMPLSAVTGHTPQPFDADLNRNDLISENGKKVQALLVKLLSHLGGMYKTSPGPDNSPTGSIHIEERFQVPSKPDVGLKVSEAAHDKILYVSGDGHSEKNQALKLGFDPVQQMSSTPGGKLAAAGKHPAAIQLNGAVAAEPSGSQNLHVDDPSAKDLDPKTDLPRIAVHESTSAETGTFSSESENDARDSKHTGPRLNFAEGITREDTGARAARAISETGDKASLSSNTRVSDSFTESAPTARDNDPAIDFSRAGALNQMIEKAALNLKNGQSELRLNLKPDFLGQVRMRIITENNQVTLKISTEYIAVKDIIETNIHQLKADLQSQGLEINSLDVSVTKDSQHQGGGNQAANLLKTEKEAGTESQRDSREQTESHQSTASGEEKNSNKTIDYFA
jgi:hypothetical protein